MIGTCSMRKRNQKCVQNLGRKTERKEIIWRASVYMRE
jgi:hypothetical protein